jgi:allantoicase
MPDRAEDMRSGWESKRSREADHQDWAVIKLACRSRLDAIEIDTAHFRGNFPYEFRVEASDSSERMPKTWTTIIKQRKGRGHYRMACKLEGEVVATHVKVIAIPDGGISRLRVYGKPNPKA